MRVSGISEDSFSDDFMNPFSTTETIPLTETMDVRDLQAIVEEKIYKAIAERRYEEVLPLYDELLNLRIQELREKGELLDVDAFEDFKLGIESEIAQAKSYYLILSGQTHEAIELCTNLIARMQLSKFNKLLFDDRVLLQIRAAAYLIEGKDSLGQKDLQESGKTKEMSAFDSIFLKNSRFEELSNLIFLKVLEQRMNVRLVEAKTVSSEELNQMSGWEKADYFLANDLPTEALKWVGDDAERRALALAQLGSFEEAMELLEDFEPQTAALICFMQNDLEGAKDLAEDTQNFSLLAIITYLQSI